MDRGYHFLDYIMLKRTYQWLIKKASHPKATWILGCLSFLESSVSPLPPDPLMIPMIIARKNRAWYLATLCTVTSVLGGALGYAIGYFLFEAIGFKILEFYNLMGPFHTLQSWFTTWGFWIIVIKGLTPIPFKVVTITSGATGLNFWTFIVASIIARGGRFFLVAAILHKYGEKAHKIIEKNIVILTIAFVVALILGFFLIKLFF